MRDIIIKNVSGWIIGQGATDTSNIAIWPQIFKSNVKPKQTNKQK